MRSARASVVAIIFLTALQLTSGQSDDVSNVQIELLKPKGLRVSIPECNFDSLPVVRFSRSGQPDYGKIIFSVVRLTGQWKIFSCRNPVDRTMEDLVKLWGIDIPKLSLFVFQGNINRSIKANDLGTLSGEALRPTAGRWVYENRNVELKDGDVINYYLLWIIDQVEHRRDNLTYQVKANRASDGIDQDGCRPTVTTMRMGKACAGQVIFEDNFDTFNEEVWQIEQYIWKEHSDYPFNSYQRSAVAIVNGSLHISPVLQQNLQGYSADSIYSGTLDLFSGCTSSAESCFMRALGPYILPPVASGRVTSKGFAFKYGTMELRARLPQGDWLYPEILLEPLLNKYGSWNQASGVLKWACARGNAVLHFGSTDYGNKILYGGPIIDTRCRDALISNKTASGGDAWGDTFHVYSMRWTPELITWSVDGAEWGRVEPGEGGLRARLPPACADTRDAPRAPPGNTKMAPFDEHFFMTLGVATGGIAEFPDGVVTMNDHPKPWRNQEVKAVLRFWQDVGFWLPTWNQSKLVVDYIRIRAL